MNKSRKLPWMAAVAMSLIFAPVAAAQEKTITLLVNKANQPAGGVPLYVLAGGRKFSQSTPPTGTTDNTGKFVFPAGVLSSNKPHTQMEVYEVCVNGQKVIFIIPKGSEDQLPKDTEDCKKRRIGGFYWDDGSTVTVDLTPGGGVTHTGGGQVAGPPGHPSVWVQVGGGPGFKDFVGTSGNCAAFSQVFPGGTCQTPSKSFAFDVDGSVHAWHMVGRGGYWRANGIQLDARGTVPGGTDILQSSLQPEAGYATGGFCIHAGSRVSLIPEAGAAFWRANIKRTETVTLGSTTTTATDSLQVTGTGPMFGGAVHFDATRHLGIEVRYLRVRMDNEPVVNDQNNMVFFNVTFRWPGR